MVAIKRFGGDFIDVILNNSVVSLFNSKSNTVMDVILQAGMNPKVLIGKNGKNVRFTLNGSKRVAFGTIAKSAIIKINGVIASMDSEIKENDKIEIQFSQNGNNAQPHIKDYVKKLDTVGFYLNNEVKNMEPIFIINGEISSYYSEIQESDNIKTIFPKTLGEYRKYYENNLNLEFYIGETRLEDSYEIEEGDKIYTSNNNEEGEAEEPLKLEATSEEPNENEEFKNSIKLKNIEEIKINDENIKNIVVKVNEKDIILSGKKDYIFVDIFNHFDFDLTISRGQLVLMLNGNKAGFSDVLNAGDIIEIRWN